MGFASYREDILKIRDDAAHFRGLLDEDIRRATGTGAPVETAREAGRRVQSYLLILDRIVSRLDKLLVLATEPEISLADEVITLRIKRNEAAADAETLRQRLADCNAAHQCTVAKLNARIAEQKRIIAELKKELRQGEEKFGRLVTENFGAAVAIYPPEKKR